MARKILDIQQGVIDAINPIQSGLSTSKYAEWRLLSYIMATVIHAFEVILDLFRIEIEQKVLVNTAGTTEWYAEMTRRFQYGHKLVYNQETAFYHYAENDPDARIIKMVAIVEDDRHIFIKVAKHDADGNIVPLSDVERFALVDYWRTMRTGGTRVTIVSTTADMIRYNLEVYYDPSTAQDTVRSEVEAALEAFKLSISFDAMFYSQRLVDAVISLPCVTTVNPVRIEHKASYEGGFSNAGVMVELASGYFNYDDKITLTLISIR